MKIAILGLWHLGLVTAACMAEKGFDVVAYDDNKAFILELQRLKLPIYESGLVDLTRHALTTGRLIFTSEIVKLQQCDLIWITYDIPVDTNDVASPHAVLETIVKFFPYFKEDALVLVSSQLPIGSTDKLQKLYEAQHPKKQVVFAYSPENLRLGDAISTFMKPERIVVGVNQETTKERLSKLLSTITHNILWMSVKSAEMTKHAINAFLATSIVFANELAILCEQVGVNVNEVERGLKSEDRIGPRAYLRAGNAFAGGTLARDLVYLVEMGQEHQQNLQLLASVLNSNIHHRQWIRRKLKELFNQDLRGKLIAVMGLAYKPGTDTLRRSNTIETCQWLREQGAQISAYDPVVKDLPIELQFIKICGAAKEAMQGASAVLIATECPEFMSLQAHDFVSSLLHPLVIDAGGFLQTNLQGDKRLNYITVGRSI